MQHDATLEQGSAGLEKDKPVEIISFWSPNVTISVINDQTVFSVNAIPPQLTPVLNVSTDRGTYNPIIYFNEFWDLSDDFVMINETTPRLPLTLTFQPLSLMRMLIMVQVCSPECAAIRG